MGIYKSYLQLISMRYYLYWYEAFWVKFKSKTMRVKPNEWTISYQCKVKVVYTLKLKTVLERSLFHHVIGYYAHMLTVTQYREKAKTIPPVSEFQLPKLKIARNSQSLGSNNTPPKKFTVIITEINNNHFKRSTLLHY